MFKLNVASFIRRYFMTKKASQFESQLGLRIASVVIEITPDNKKYVKEIEVSHRTNIEGHIIRTSKINKPDTPDKQKLISLVQDMVFS